MQTGSHRSGAPVWEEVRRLAREVASRKATGWERAGSPFEYLVLFEVTTLEETHYDQYQRFLWHTYEGWSLLLRRSDGEILFVPWEGRDEQRHSDYDRAQRAPDVQLDFTDWLWRRGPVVETGGKNHFQKWTATRGSDPPGVTLTRTLQNLLATAENESRVGPPSGPQALAAPTVVERRQVVRRRLALARRDAWLLGLLALLLVTAVAPWAIGRWAADSPLLPRAPGLASPDVRDDGDYRLPQYLAGASALLGVTAAVLLLPPWRRRGAALLAVSVLLLGAVALRAPTLQQWQEAEAASLRTQALGGYPFREKHDSCASATVPVREPTSSPYRGADATYTYAVGRTRETSQQTCDTLSVYKGWQRLHHVVLPAGETVPRDAASTLLVGVGERRPAQHLFLSVQAKKGALVLRTLPQDPRDRTRTTTLPGWADTKGKPVDLAAIGTTLAAVPADGPHQGRLQAVDATTHRTRWARPCPSGEAPRLDMKRSGNDAERRTRFLVSCRDAQTQARRTWAVNLSTGDMTRPG